MGGGRLHGLGFGGRFMVVSGPGGDTNQVHGRQFLVECMPAYYYFIGRKHCLGSDLLPPVRTPSRESSLSQLLCEPADQARPVPLRWATLWSGTEEPPGSPRGVCSGKVRAWPLTTPPRSRLFPAGLFPSFSFLFPPPPSLSLPSVLLPLHDDTHTRAILRMQFQLHLGSISFQIIHFFSGLKRSQCSPSVGDT